LFESIVFAQIVRKLNKMTFLRSVSVNWTVNIKNFVLWGVGLFVTKKLFLQEKGLFLFRYRYQYDLTRYGRKRQKEKKLPCDSRKSKIFKTESQKRLSDISATQFDNPFETWPLSQWLESFHLLLKWFCTESYHLVTFCESNGNKIKVESNQN
jgi:hypothetical protein